MSEDNSSTKAPLQPGQEEIKKPDASDQLTPEHPRFKDVYNRMKTAEDKAESLQTQFDELSAKINTRTQETGDEELTAEDLANLDRIDKELRRRKGYVTREDLDAEKRTDNLKEGAKVHDGSDGLPKWDSVEVVAYAKAHGFGENYDAAYNDMHYDARVQVEAEKKAKNPTPPSSERPGGGGREELESDLTAEDIANMTDEEYEKNRTKILSGMKTSLNK